MLSCSNMFLPKQRQKWLLHCWSKQHKVCHCYNELCWLGIKLGCPWEWIFCSDDPNCAKWKCLAAQMTNMSHSGCYKWKLPAENLYPGFVQPLSFMSSQKIQEEKKPCCQYGIKPCLGNCFSCLTSFCLSWLCFLRKKQLMGMDACQQLQPWLCWLFHSLITWASAFNIIDESSDYALGAGLLPHPVMWTEGRLRRLQSVTVMTRPSQWCYNTGQAENSWLVCKLQS